MILTELNILIYKWKKVYITLIMKFGVNIKKDAKIYYTVRYTSVYNETVFAFTWMLFWCLSLFVNCVYVLPTVSFAYPLFMFMYRYIHFLILFMFMYSYIHLFILFIFMYMYIYFLKEMAMCWKVNLYMYVRCIISFEMINKVVLCLP